MPKSKKYGGLYDNIEQTVQINPLSGLPFSQEYFDLQKNVVSKLPMTSPETSASLQSSFQNNQVTILSAQTGAGKSTTIGQHLLSFLRSVVGPSASIWLTQPRRLATQTVSDTVAKWMDVRLGEGVGRRMQGEAYLSDATRLLFVTEGLLFIKFVENPDLTGLHGVVIDEAHERNVDTDLNLLFLRRLIDSGTRPDLKIVIMSATADIQTFIKYFPGCGLVEVPGRTNPVENIFAKQNYKDLVQAAVEKVIDICNNPKHAPGDILIFFAGARDSMKCNQELNKRRDKIKGTFSSFEFSRSTSSDAEMYLNVTKRSAQELGVDRKIVISTPIAEASVTIDGIVYVIDAGKANISSYDTKLKHDILKEGWISKANAIQRMGRAGRTRPGICYKLYTESQYKHMDAFEMPKVLREDLTTKFLGVLGVPEFNNVNDLWKLTRKMLTPPPKENMQIVFNKFKFLAIIDAYGDITLLGKKMARMAPLPAELSRAMLFSSAYACRPEMMMLAAIYNEERSLLESLITERQPDRRLIDLDGEIFSAIKILKTAIGLRSSPNELQKFCRDYKIDQTKIDKAINDYGRLRYKFEGLYDVLPRSGQSIVKIPYFEIQDDVPFCWGTTPLSSSVKDRVVQCLMHGYFMNALVRRGGEVRTFDTDIKIDDQLRSQVGFYLKISKNMFRYNVAGKTEVKDIAWFADAAMHYIPFIDNPKNEQIIQDAVRRRDSIRNHALPDLTGKSIKPVSKKK